MLLPPPPKRGKGVKRLNKRPVIAVAVLLLIIVLIIAYTYQQRMARQQEAAAAADVGQTQGAASHAKDVVSTSPAAAPAQTTARETPPQTLPPMAMPIRDVQATQGAPDAAEQARQKAWATYYQQIAQLEQSKADAANKAMASDTEVSGPGGQGGGPAGGIIPAGPAGMAAPGLPQAGVDAGAQAEKRAFLAQGGDPLGINEDLIASLHGMKPDTIMAGTALPGAGVGEVTSDMPGMIVGQISQNVYDTATGNDLLIPQGTRIVGGYDNSVSTGQERLGVAWNRLIFPDSSSLQLGSFEGADQSGKAGEHDLVDKHWGEKFLMTTIIAIGGAAAQLSQPQQSPFSGYSPTSTASASLTQQYSQLGNEVARAGMNVPDSIVIRAGYPFVIMVSKDIHLPVYVDHRNARAASAAHGPILQ